MGASGSGTTTLGRAVAQRFGWRHFDADDYAWLPSDPPFKTMRPLSVARRLLARDAYAHDDWALTGSIASWCNVAIPRFHLVVFLTCPAAVRMERLREREEADGIPERQADEFLAWAARYDDGGLEVRSRLLHERWLEALSCPVLRVGGDEPLDRLVGRVCHALDTLPG